MPPQGVCEEFGFPAGYFEADNTYRLTVTPLSYFDKSSDAIYGEFTIGKVPWTEVPVKYEVQWQPWKSSKVLPIGADGFVEVSGDVRYLLPSQGAETALKTKRKNVIVSMDIECIGKGVPASLRISNNRNQIITQNTASYRETPQKQRYTFIYQPQKKDKAHYLLIRRGSDAKFRITNLRSFVY